jgi:hypothetical protein
MSACNVIPDDPNDDSVVDDDVTPTGVVDEQLLPGVEAVVSDPAVLEVVVGDDPEVSKCPAEVPSTTFPSHPGKTAESRNRESAAMWFCMTHMFTPLRRRVGSTHR